MVKKIGFNFYYYLIFFSAILHNILHERFVSLFLLNKVSGSSLANWKNICYERLVPSKLTDLTRAGLVMI